MRMSDRFIGAAKIRAILYAGLLLALILSVCRGLMGLA